MGTPFGEPRVVRLMARLTDLAGAAYQTFRSKTKVRDSERRLREILDALPAAVYTTDAEGRVTMFNQAAATFAGRFISLTACPCHTTNARWRQP